MQTVVVDNKTFYLPSEQDWRELLAGHRLLQRTLRLPDFVATIMSGVADTKNLLFGVTVSPLNEMDWWFAPMLLRANYLYRVSLEEWSCRQCDWRGMAGIARGDEYVGMAKAEERLSELYALPALPCPSCHQLLKSVVVWVDRGAS